MRGLIPSLVLRALLAVALLAPNLLADSASARTAMDVPNGGGRQVSRDLPRRISGDAAALPHSGRAGEAEGNAPAAGGTFAVNSALDTNSGGDGVLTLREAILLADGGTDGVGGLGRGLTNSEKSQVSGCIWSGGAGDWHFNGLCGAGITDTIVFSLPALSLITLSSALPPISDTVGTIVDGGSNVPAIDATSGGGDGLWIGSANNSIANLIVEKAPSQNFRVTGSNNQLNSLHSWYGNFGITLAGDHNLVDSSTIGLGLFGGCAGGTGWGILIASGKQYNTVSHSTIVCSGTGLALGQAGGAGNNTIGPGNFIGTDSSGTANLGNALRGLFIYSDSNAVFSNTIAFNQGDGLSIYYSFNIVTGNTVISNTGNGLGLYNGGQNNYIGCTLLCLSANGNRLSGNLGYGIEITGTSDAFNFVEANLIGVDAGGTHPQGNALGGVLVDGAHDTLIGDTGSRWNTISGNGGDGITLAHSAYGNTIVFNYLGTNAAVHPLGNLGNGISLRSGAHDNTIGQSDPQYVNEIVNNHLNGILVDGAATTLNTIYRNRVYDNTLDGIALSNGANHTHLGETDYNHLNSVYQNRSGLALTAGANSNYIYFNSFDTNDRHGILLSGVGTTGNVFSLTWTYQNQLDGINEGSGADFNRWTQLSAHYGPNGGLGIDKNALDDSNNTITPPLPVIMSVVAAGGMVTVSGTASPALTETVSVELYRADANPSGYGEGKSYLGTVNATAAGSWSLSFNAPGALCYTAFQTRFNTLLNTVQSSEYGPNSCRLLLPIIRR